MCALLRVFGIDRHTRASKLFISQFGPSAIQTWSHARKQQTHTQLRNSHSLANSQPHEQRASKHHMKSSSSSTLPFAAGAAATACLLLHELLALELDVAELMLL